MGSPTIWYYPEDGGTLQAITLPDLSSLEMLPDVDVVSARSRSGRTTTYQFSSFRRWALAATFTDQATLRALRSFEAHVWRGGAFAFALDSAKAWAGSARRQIVRGDTTILVSPLSLLNPAATLAAGDDVWIESASPERRADMREVSSFSTSSIVVDAAVSYTFRATPVVIRHADYFPSVVQTAPGEPIVVDRGQRNAFDFVIEMAEAPDNIRALAAGVILQGATPAFGGGPLAAQPNKPTLGGR